MKNDNNTALRVFLRTTGLLFLFTVLLINYRSTILPYSAFSIANAMTHLDTEHFKSIGLIKDISYFFLIVILLHISWAALITISYYAIKRSNRSNFQNELIWLLLVMSHITFIVGLNSYLYPTSITAYFRSEPYSSPYFLFATGSILTFIFFIGAHKLEHKKTTYTFVITCICIIIYPFSKTQISQFEFDKPNIIIVGIDGLRPDHLSYENQQFNHVPFINNLLEKSTVYKNSYSPQSRTYVAWMSILTGQYPKTNGARFNLAPPELINKNIPILEALNKGGYHTTYAMDERRFNQIDESYGFNSTAGPKIGAADAFISSFADFPYINILLNHPYSDILFPYLNNNRAYGKTYSPSSFNKGVISKLNPKKTNFLSIHFCQLHWPYTSSDFIEQDLTEWNGNYSHFMYKSMLAKVDKQIESFFADLTRLDYLNNSIVYLISDHGEGFKLGENVSILGTANSPSLQSWGHGTNVLDQMQTKVLLARVQFKNGKTINKPGIIDGLFSLVDILPTINKELNLKLPVTLDGVPLPNRESNVVEERFVFVESSLPSKAMNASFIDEKKVVSEVGKNYIVRSSGEAVMKPIDYKNLLSRKQRSVYYREYQLALLPKLNSLVFMDFTNNSVKVIEDEENDIQIHKMLKNLCLFYKDDFGFDKMNKCANLTTEVNDNAQKISQNN